MLSGCVVFTTGVYVRKNCYVRDNHLTCGTCALPELPLVKKRGTPKMPTHMVSIGFIGASISKPSGDPRIWSLIMDLVTLGLRLVVFRAGFSRDSAAQFGSQPKTSISQERALLGAIWALAGQPICSSHTQRVYAPSELLPACAADCEIQRDARNRPSDAFDPDDTASPIVWTGV